ncbi:unnamed protein product [Scytosiphon promiscuus]
MSSNVPDDSAAGATPQPPEEAEVLTSSGAELQANVQVEGSSQVPPSNVDGEQPTRPAGDRPQEAPVSARHGDAICYIPGCERPAEEGQMSEDGRSIDRVCSEHKRPAVVVPTVRRAEKCEHDGCQRTPRYGIEGEPLSFCQGHKRAGMYTCRDGELFIATRDGSALRNAPGSSTVGSSASGASPPSVPTPGASAPGASAPGASAPGASAPGVSAPATSAPGVSVSGTPVSGASTSAASAAATATDTSGQTPAPAPPQELKNEMPSNNLPMLVLPQKLCEEPGCEAQPSYGLPGSGNPQYCSSHKKEGLVSLKNRPCVQPGCNTRPHYGVSRGKAVYCVTHKLPGMVHLLKEAKTLEKEAHALRRRKSRLNIAAKKRAEKEAIAGKVGAITEGPTLKEEEGGEETHETDGPEEEEEEEEEEGEGRDRENKSKGKRPARAKGVPRKAAFAAGAVQAKARKTSATAKPSPPPPPLPPASNSASSPRPAAQKQRKPYASRPEDPAGLAPSDEMRLFQEVRELARASAVASGSGRRARAPSRKVLEASGKLAGGSIQWMTKEKKEEQARRTQEIKEQRRVAAAAGLKLGHVIETITLPPAGDAGAPGLAGGGSSGGGASSGGASSGAASSSPASIGGPSGSPTSTGATSSGAVSSSPASNPSSDLASGGGFPRGSASESGSSSAEEAPAARSFGRPVPAAGNTQASAGAAENPPCSRDTANEPNGEATADEQERSVAPAAVAEAGTAVAAKKRNSNASDVEGDEARLSKRSRHADGDGGSDGSKEKGEKTACESENCLKTATYGINGIVRYCKKHQIFGMQKIADER